jgi:adenine-specific DNA-methyltransferase
VLQETMIIRIKKTQIKPSQITVTFSETYELSNTKTITVPYNTVVAPNGYVFLVTTDEELEVLKRINRQDSTLKKNNTKMQTGIIVDFRTREVLRDCADEGVYPLFYSQHIKDGKVHFPVGRPSEFICTDRKSFLQDNVNYVFVKRFTAKEEKRRLQCGIYLASEHPEYKFISTQNKINYIRCHSEEEAYGIYAILNSTLYDTYYRILNGSTQVNSTEINNMQIPSSDTVSKIGKELIGGNLSEENCNTIIDKWIK